MQKASGIPPEAFCFLFDPGAGSDLEKNYLLFMMQLYYKVICRAARHGGTIIRPKEAHMKRFGIIFLLISHMFILVAPCLAGEREGAFSISPFLGGYSYDGTQHFETKPVYGLRLGYDVMKNWSVEGVFDYVATETTQSRQSLNVYSYRLDMLYNFMPEDALVPYLAVGGGWATKEPTHGKEYSDATFNFGGGLKYYFTDTVALRGDVRQLLVFADHTVNNWEYSVGLSFLFGGKKPSPPVTKPESTPATEPTPATSRYCTTPLNMLFDIDKATIRDEYRNDVDQIGMFMQKSPSTTALIEGHADDKEFSPKQSKITVNYLDNLEISQRRAESVANYLVKKFGIARSRISVRWYGETHRIDYSGTPEGRAKNCRVNVTLDCGIKK